MRESNHREKQRVEKWLRRKQRAPFISQTRDSPTKEAAGEGEMRELIKSFFLFGRLARAMTTNVISKSNMQGGFDFSEGSTLKPS
jgi:hypothetical protein